MAAFVPIHGPGSPIDEATLAAAQAAALDLVIQLDAIDGEQGCDIAIMRACDAYGAVPVVMSLASIVVLLVHGEVDEIAAALRRNTTP